MGGCQNYAPFLGFFFLCRIILNRDPKRDHNFDNHPCRHLIHIEGPVGLPYTYLLAQVYTIHLHGPLGLGFIERCQELAFLRT